MQGIAFGVAGIGCIEMNQCPFRYGHVKSRVCDRCAVDKDLESVLIGIAKIIGHSKRDIISSGIKDQVNRFLGAAFHSVHNPLIRRDAAVGIPGS